LCDTASGKSMTGRPALAAALDELDDVAQQVVWATVHDALPPLRAIINSELAPYE
jgi:hypothetical protein